MGTLFGKFHIKEKERNCTMKYSWTFDIEIPEKVTDIKNTSCTAKWNFEDEYELYFDKTLKRKRSDIVFHPRKRVTRNGKNYRKLSDLQLMEPQFNSELKVNLDRTIVKRYLKAKKTIDQILRPGESKSDYRSHLYIGQYER